MSLRENAQRMAQHQADADAAHQQWLQQRSQAKGGRG